MQMRLTVDRDRCIVAVASAMVSGPYDTCAGVNPNFQRLVGKSMASGFRKALRERLGGVEGCTHVLALLEAMAASAVQAFASRFHTPRAPGGPEPVRIFKPYALMDTCHSYRAEGVVMQRLLGDVSD